MNDRGYENNPAAGSTPENPRVISYLTPETATAIDPNLELAAETREFVEAVRQRQETVAITYINFKGEYEQGQIVVDKAVASSVKDIFAELLARRFPIGSIEPIAKYEWNDQVSMQINNSSAFNVRRVGNTQKLSLHSFGIAIDINPWQNPQVQGESVEPKGASYDSTGNVPGTVNHEIVEIFAKHGFQWGGNWSSLKDYQHFQIDPDTLRNRAVQILTNDPNNEAAAAELAYWQRVIDLQKNNLVSQ